MISHNDYCHSYSVVRLYCHTGSEFYCNTVFCISSIPVYPSTIHGHCIVVLDTSNISILHCTILKVNTVYCSFL
jgi:hypothetical protein